MSKVNIKIEGVAYQVEAGMTILEAAKACGYEIPSLCAFNHGECNVGSCRVCLVEATGARGLVASCVYPVAEGMEIRISSPKAVEARRRSVELLLSNHNKNCQHLDGTPLKPEEERLVLVMLEIDMTKQVEEWTQMKFLIAQVLLKDDTLTVSPGTDTCIEGDTGTGDAVNTAATPDDEDGNSAG
ncbi:MAG: (2Fe-2S)-binding protein [Oscillospiraceae bacterium]|nr:(2Fe-2S)-binding protein [Oscillospiraceae bacterium]